MLNVAEIGVDADVFVGNIIPVGVPYDGEVRRVGHVQVVALPCQPVNAVETVGECFCLVGDAVVVTIDQDFDRVTGRILFWLSELRPLRNESPAKPVERNAGGVADEWFTGEETNLKPLRQGGETGFGCIEVGRVCDDTRKQPCNEK